MLGKIKLKSNLVLESYWLLVNFFEWSEEGEVQAPGVSMGLFFLKDDVIILRLNKTWSGLDVVHTYFLGQI